MAPYQWHIMRSGDADRPLVWFLHGFLGAASDWTPVVTRLGNEYACRAVDLPGHGLTRTVEADRFFTMPTVAGALAEVIEGTGTPATLVGYSMGGRLALYMAVHYPQLLRSVVIESGSPGLQDETERCRRQEHDNALADRLQREPLEDFLHWWYRQPLFATLSADPLRLQKIVQRRRRQDAQQLARSLRMMGSGIQPPLWDDLPGIACPTHLIVGENDRKFRQIARRMTERNNRFTSNVIEGAGHNTHEECPELFTAALKRLLQKES
jgi:2-succinyl-6-hydroxy-2,4-cyclohexadiene-1-carboxylate synthase